MKCIIEQLESHGRWKNLIRQSCKQNSLKTSHANELTLLKLSAIYGRLTKSYETLGEKVSTIWIQNELKTFNWLLLAISGLHDIPINNFGQQQWALLESIFEYKKRSFLKFEAKRLMFSRNPNKYWTPEESELLRKIVEDMGRDSNQWNEIARKMFDLSNQQIFRTGKHCRERWLNYIDPSKFRGQWKEEEDIYLLTKVQDCGKKWSEYAAYLTRTEHQVKNRFNSLIMKQQKLSDKLKKQEWLISEILKKMGQDGPFQPDQLLEENCQIFNPKEENIARSEAERRPQEMEKIEDEVDIMQVDPQNMLEDIPNRPVICQQEPNHDTNIHRFTKDQQEFKNIPTLNQFGIYSPYWNYSPVNNTPNNNFMNSPSPLSFYVNSNFANYFSRFNAQLQHNIAAPEDNQ